MGKKKNKSKAPVGRAKAKNKAQKGASSSGWSNNFVRGSDMARQMLDDDDDDEPVKLFKGFTQNKTSKNSSPRNPSSKLRHQAIAFVSAGNNISQIEQQAQQSQEAVFVPAEESDDEEDEEEDEEDEEDLDDSAIQTNLVTATEVETSQDAIAHLNIQSTEETIISETHRNMSDIGMLDVDGTAGSDHIEEPSESLPYVMDTVGDPSLGGMSNASSKQPLRREPSPTPSDSSEEVVFLGRNKARIIDDPVEEKTSKPSAPQPSLSVSQPHSIDSRRDLALQHHTPQPQRSRPQSRHSTSRPPPQQQHSTHHPGDDWDNFNPRQHRGQYFPAEDTKAKGWAGKPSRADHEVNAEAIWAPAPSGSWWRKEKQSEKSAEETIASLQADVRNIQREKQQARQQASQEDNGSNLNSKQPYFNRRGKRGRRKDNRQMRQSVEFDDDDDDDDSAAEAAYDDYMANLAAQLGDEHVGATNGSHRFTAINSVNTAMGGPSLVVNGKEIGEDEVLPEESGKMEDDTSSVSSAQIRQKYDGVYEDDDSQDGSHLSGGDSTNLEDELEYTEQEQWEDEVDLRRRRQENMTDEKIARMFAKQQEMGIDDDDLVIEDGDFEEFPIDVDGIGDVEAARAAFANITNFTSGRPSNKHRMRRSGNRNGGNFNFPDASALADTVEQYGENGFDIMDFDRPSLRPLKKGRKGNMPAELEALDDEELKENLFASWDNDRRKKSLKKAEREELRAQGLLGSMGKKGKADLGQRYQFGMTTTQIKNELRIFLQDPKQQARPFPPMDKKDRKALHEIASALNLTSKSVGGGNNRFPVLNKTSRTFYDEVALNRVFELSSKDLLRGVRGGRGKLGGKNVRQAGKMPRSLNAGLAAATVRNGEVVGAGADKIGKESFGYRMMNKMGWSEGTALGKDGEGMLTPVEQVMRAGKAGLG